LFSYKKKDLFSPSLFQKNEEKKEKKNSGKIKTKVRNIHAFNELTKWKPKI
jgi:hypothetical protein